MKFLKKEAGTVHTAIHGWADEGVITGEQAEKLHGAVQIISFDWRRLARYSFWGAIVCILISVGSVVADDALRKLLSALFNAPDIVKCLFFASVAVALYYVGVRRKRKHPEKRFSNEAFFFLGVMATAGAIAFLGVTLDTGSGHFSLLLLLAAILYGLLGIWFPSTLVWIFSLLSLASWLGAESGYMSGWGAYYLGMNFPLRFVLIGALFLLGCSLAARLGKGKLFLKSTRVMGYLYLFIALWIMSIFGNYGDMSSWYDVRQYELLHWSVLFGAAALGAIYYGIRHDDGVSRGFGITFLFLNLYTRFFEYFWDLTHKAIFFAVLALSFWALGTRAEKIWNVGRGIGGGQAEPATPRTD